MRKAFTLIEVLILISMMGILSAGILFFLDDTERRTMLNAETCLNRINADIKNFTNAAMTSKQLRISTGSVSPDYYFIKFQPSTLTSSWTITFEYETSTGSTWIYQEIPLHRCKSEKVQLDFAAGTTLKVVRMNSGFRQLKPSELSTFSLLSGTDAGRIFTGEIPLNVCLYSGCEKEFAKWVVDTRSQGIFSQKCLFYSTGDTLECEKREGEV